MVDTENSLNRLIDRLVGWADYMGGWDSPVWREAERAGSLDDNGRADLLRRLLEWEQSMGGFEAPIWEEARELQNRLDGSKPPFPG